MLYKDGTLEIPQISENDSGAYRCIVKYRSNTLESRVVYVKVLTTVPKATSIQSTKKMPVFLAWPEDQSVQESDEVILECMAYNDAFFLSEYNSSFILKNKPQFYTYKWLKDGLALDLK